jgi:hypothetical protein
MLTHARGTTVMINKVKYYVNYFSIAEQCYCLTNYATECNMYVSAEYVDGIIGKPNNTVPVHYGYCEGF